MFRTTNGHIYAAKQPYNNQIQTTQLSDCDNLHNIRYFLMLSAQQSQ